MWTRFLRRVMARYALKMSHCTSGGYYYGGEASHCGGGETLYKKVGHGHCVTYEPVHRGAASHCS